MTTPPRPPASDALTQDRMRAQRQRDTRPEVELRRSLWALGLRYRVDVPIPIPSRRRADVLFRSARVAVFVDGCFWHGCPQHATAPKSNSEWWAQKLDANVARDRDTDERLGHLGWLSVRVWEHEEAAVAASRIKRIVTQRRGRRSGPSDQL